MAEYSHLFKVQGLDSKLTPYLLAAHLDVVPALPEGWEFPPFSGTHQGGFIYGRGTLDDKQSVVVSFRCSSLNKLFLYAPL